MITLLVVAVIGGFATAIVLWSYGAILALLCAPLGGSLLAAIAAVLMALRSRRRVRPVHKGDPPPKD